MRRIALTLGLGLALLLGMKASVEACGCSSATKKSETKVQHVDKDALLKLIKEEKNLVIVDVLSEESFAKNHIKGAVNIPLKTLKDGMVNLKKDATIVVYCANTKCKASTRAAKMLLENGFANVRDYEDGIADWVENKLPVETGKVASCKAGKAKACPSSCSKKACGADKKEKACCGTCKGKKACGGKKKDKSCAASCSKKACGAGKKEKACCGTCKGKKACEGKKKDKSCAASCSKKACGEKKKDDSETKSTIKCGTSCGK